MDPSLRGYGMIKPFVACMHAVAYGMETVVPLDKIMGTCILIFFFSSRLVLSKK